MNTHNYSIKLRKPEFSRLYCRSQLLHIPVGFNPIPQRYERHIAIFPDTYKLYCKQYPFLLGSNIVEKMPEKALKAVIVKPERFTANWADSELYNPSWYFIHQNS